MDPIFRRIDGKVDLRDTQAATRVIAEGRENSYRGPLPLADVRKAALSDLKKAGGNADDTRCLIGFHRLQFGKFRGETFRWILENSPGYAGWLANKIAKEKPNLEDKRYGHKLVFKRYVEAFEEGREVIASKRTGPTLPPVPQPRRAREHVPEHQQQVRPSTSRSTPARSTTFSAEDAEANVVPGRARPPVPRPGRARERVARVQQQQVRPSILRSTPARSTTFSAEDAEADAVPGPARPPVPRPGRARERVARVQQQQVRPSILRSTPARSTTFSAEDAEADAVPGATAAVRPMVTLPVGWHTTLPEVDHQWVSKKFFIRKLNGQIALMNDLVVTLWWYPPPPMAAPSSQPRVERYFAHPLLMWMPRRIWRVKLVCLKTACARRELTSCGVYQKVRHVIDIEQPYNMATEYLECHSCTSKYVGWSHTVLSQLDVGHRTQFPCILTQKLACDLKVIRLLRSRGLGNSCGQVQKKLMEQHTETYLQKVLQYLTDCSGFTRAASSGVILPVVSQELPELQKVPGPKWLMQVYCQDVLHRLPEIKASITSVFGDVLKIDSTKKIVKKLAGDASRTAVWCTNVGNEHSQVVCTVLTAAEGGGIKDMITGIIRRYRRARVPSPSVMYTDRDCCGSSQLKKMLAPWSETCLRLDIWHFMRRFSSGLTTDSHLLYAPFMAGLSNCIFEWDLHDMNQLIQAKAAELEMKAGRPFLESEVKNRLRRKELSLHCQRRTRGGEETATLIDQLLETYGGPAGRDSLGVPLINKERMAVIWSKQRTHTACIQDPPNVHLYTRTKTLKKGGHPLPVYRCARGSTSLEGFHLHLNRFIPGTVASDVNFQAYLLDGVFRWNKDRGDWAAAAEVSQQLTYSGELQHAVNKLGEEVLGRTICPNYRLPFQYTDELLGIEYLYSQTGKVLDDYLQVIATVEEEPTHTDDDFNDEGFEEEMEDLTVPLAAEVSPERVHSPRPSKAERPTALQATKKRRLTLPLQSQLDPIPVATTETETPVSEAERPTALQEPPKKRQLPLPLQPDLYSIPAATTETETPVPVATRPAYQLLQTTQPPQPAVTEQQQVPHEEETLVDSEAERPTALQEPPKKRQLPLPLQPDLYSIPAATTETETPVPVATRPAYQLLQTTQPPQPAVTEQQQVPHEEETLVDDSVDSDNIGGYQQVQDLATYLTSLRNSVAVTNSQACEVVRLWSELADFDKKSTSFAQRFSKKPPSGRFRTTKSVLGVHEGVASTKRAFVGANQGPAQWPDCNRITEAVISQLLREFPSDIRRQGEKMTRFGLVLTAYGCIVDAVYGNATIVAKTLLQLPKINKATLTQWFNKGNKSRDRQMLMQGIQQPALVISEGPALQPLQRQPVQTAGRHPQTTGPALQPRRPLQPRTLQPRPLLTEQPTETTGPALQPRRPLQPRPLQPRPLLTEQPTETTGPALQPRRPLQPRPLQPRPLLTEQPTETTGPALQPRRPLQPGPLQPRPLLMEQPTETTGPALKPRRPLQPRPLHPRPLQPRPLLTEQPTETTGPALLQPRLVQTDASQQLHQFDLPPNTSGTAKLKRRRSDAVVQGEDTTASERFVIFEGKAYPIVVAQPTIVPNIDLPHTGAQVVGVTNVPYSTQRYRKQKVEEEKDGKKRRKYTKHKDFIACKMCGKDRAEGGHRQYFSNWYCPATALVSYDDWLEPLLARNYGKKK